MRGFSLLILCFWLYLHLKHIWWDIRVRNEMTTVFFIYRVSFNLFHITHALIIYSDYLTFFYNVRNFYFLRKFLSRIIVLHMHDVVIFEKVCGLESRSWWDWGVKGWFAFRITLLERRDTACEGSSYAVRWAFILL